MTFEDKARYPGPFDDNGIPLLDYHGTIGKQYYSVAISQYALGNYNVHRKTGQEIYLDRFLKNAEWLLKNLIKTDHGTYLWPTFFEFEYFRTLKSPWFSGLAQGQGLSVLVRAFVETGSNEYRTAAEHVYESLTLPIESGGVVYVDNDGSPWIEEYVIEPPTHILNGFIWALWGIYDYYLLTKEDSVLAWFEAYKDTICKNLSRYDSSFWSYYELSPQAIKSPASLFYHRLHIVQLRVMHTITGDREFREYAEKWTRYQERALYRHLAFLYKLGFKIVYY